MPFGAAKVEETEVGFLLTQRVGVYPKRQLGVCVAELVRDPPDTLAGGDSQTGEGMACVVESQWTDAVDSRLSA